MFCLLSVIKYSPCQPTESFRKIFYTNGYTKVILIREWNILVILPEALVDNFLHKFGNLWNELTDSSQDAWRKDLKPKQINQYIHPCTASLGNKAAQLKIFQLFIHYSRAKTTEFCTMLFDLLELS